MLEKAFVDVAPLRKNASLSDENHFLLCAALIILISFVAVSNESLWIDECSTAHFATQPSLEGSFQEMMRLKWPEIQAPLYMVYIWSWVKVFGSKEWVLRFAGVPWFIAGAVLFVSSWKERVQRTCAAAVVGLSPFVWFYLNEARLYSIQIGLSLAVIASLVHLKRDDIDGKAVQFRWLALFCLSTVLLSLVNVLGMIWATSAFLILPLICSLTSLLRWFRQYWVMAGSTALILAACAVYYLWTRTLGIAPTGVAKTDWQTLAFILYEQLGFNGLGPGRLSLREGGVATLKPWVPWLVLYALGISIVFFAAVRNLTQPRWRRDAVLAVLAISLPAVFIISLGFLTKFRVLGRHFTPFVGVVLFLFSVGAANLFDSRRWWVRAGLSAFLLLALLSCLSERFSSRHARDDYRGAAELAKLSLAQGQSVWWNAAEVGSEYYGVPVSEEPSAPGKAWLISFPEEGFEPKTARPDIVVASAKTGIYDRRGALHAFLRKEGYAQVKTLTAFEIYRKK